MNVLIGASHGSVVEDPRFGVKYAVEATDVAESNDGVPADRTCPRAWCERGVAEFLASGAAAAFPAGTAGEYLFIR